MSPCTGRLYAAFAFCVQQAPIYHGTICPLKCYNFPEPKSQWCRKTDRPLDVSLSPTGTRVLSRGHCVYTNDDLCSIQIYATIILLKNDLRVLFFFTRVLYNCLQHYYTVQYYDPVYVITIFLYRQCRTPIQLHNSPLKCYIIRFAQLYVLFLNLFFSRLHSYSFHFANEIVGCVASPNRAHFITECTTSWSNYRAPTCGTAESPSFKIRVNPRMSCDDDSSRMLHNPAQSASSVNRDENDNVTVIL